MAKVYAFDEGDVKRIRESLEWFEGRYRNAPPARARYPIVGGSVLVQVQIISNVTAGTIATPTTFTYQYLAPNASTPGHTVTNTTHYTGYNDTPGTLSASSGGPKKAWLAFDTGYYYLVSAAC